MGLLSKVSGWLDKQEERAEKKRKIEQYLVWVQSKTAEDISGATGVELEPTNDILTYMVGMGSVKSKSIDGVTYYSYNKQQRHGAGCPCCGGMVLPY